MTDATVAAARMRVPRGRPMREQDEHRDAAGGRDEDQREGLADEPVVDALRVGAQHQDADGGEDPAPPRRRRGRGG